MTINDPDAFLASLWDWGFLDQCFDGTNIRITDIDGFVERNNRFLILETKLPGVSIPWGQWIVFNRLRATGLFTIFVVWGHKNQPQKIQVITKQRVYEPTQCDLEAMIGYVKKWFVYANGQKAPWLEYNRPGQPTAAA